MLTALAAGAVALAVLGTLALAHSPLWALGALPVTLLGAFLILFFRNPAREIPIERGLLVSPADGTVRDIVEVDEPDFVQARCVRIGIFLSIFDVHLNRAPASGRVEWVHHCPGKYHDARSELAAVENESNGIGMVIEEEDVPAGARLLVKQISGAIARRIVCPLLPPASVARGGLVGMIKYGSRTELFIPLDRAPQVRVRVGDKVRAGTSVLASWAG